MDKLIFWMNTIYDRHNGFKLVSRGEKMKNNKINIALITLITVILIGYFVTINLVLDNNIAYGKI